MKKEDDYLMYEQGSMHNITFSGIIIYYKEYIIWMDGNVEKHKNTHMAKDMKYMTSQGTRNR